MAPPRRPTQLKVLSGTLRPSRENPLEPVGDPVALPEAPKDLSDDEKAMWEELAKRVGPMHVATDADLFVFREMVVVAAMLRALRRSFIDNGNGEPIYEVVTKTGVMLMRRPEVDAIATYEKLFLQFVARFGI